MNEKEKEKEKEREELENISTDILVNELVRRGATLTETKIYGEYKLIKKYSSGEREVFSRLLILNNLPRS